MPSEQLFPQQLSDMGKDHRSNGPVKQLCNREKSSSDCPQSNSLTREKSMEQLSARKWPTSNCSHSNCLTWKKTTKQLSRQTIVEQETVTEKLATRQQSGWCLTEKKVHEQLSPKFVNQQLSSSKFYVCQLLPRPRGRWGGGGAEKGEEVSPSNRIYT